MGSIERRERERNGTRAKILDAARELFVRHGCDAVSMRKIADAIEYSPTAIYVHFKDKQDLLAELCREDCSRLSAGTVELAKITDPIARIRAMGRAYIEFAVRHPTHYRLMFMTPLGPNRPAPSDDDLCRKDDPAQNAFAALIAAVREAAAAGRFRRELRNDHALIAQTLWAAVHGVASLQIAKADDPWVEWAPLERRIDAMVDGIIRGLVRDESPRSSVRTRSFPATLKRRASSRQKRGSTKRGAA